ncbi:MAG: DUF4249 domain-containing protein [Bacteroidota bacterium]
MSNKINYLLAVLVLVAFAVACVDEIDLNVDTTQRSVVVDGFVTDSMGDFRLKLSQSSVIGIGNDNILDPINGAAVNLMDTDGQAYPYVEEEDGSYLLSDFKALRGKSYYIDIVLPDGRHYQSTPTSLRSNSSIDDIGFEVAEETYRNNAGNLVTDRQVSMKIGTNTSNAETPPFLRWRVEGEYQFLEGFPGSLNNRYCYIPTNLDINDIRILDASSLNNGELFEQVIAATEYDFRFAIQFCFHVSQYSISEEEYTYWRNIKEIIDIDGGLFDPPPGTIVGNIKNVDDPNDVAVGYFSVASVFFKRVFVNRDDLDFFVRGKCEGFFFEIPFGCDNCLDITNSTLERPDYWEF